MARRIKNRKLKYKYVVLGDGQTEQYYFTHLKEINSYGYSIRPGFFNDISLSDAESIIDDLLDGGVNKIIFITDYDTVINDNRQDLFNKLKKKYDSNPEVMILETMPSIEYWFLLHHQFSTQLFINSKQVESQLKKYIPDYCKKKHYLEKIKWVMELCSDNKLKTARFNASKGAGRKANENVDLYFPFTNVHFGIDEFEKQKKK